MTVQLDTRHDITLETYRRVAWQNEPVALSSACLERMAACRTAFEKLIAEDPAVTIYGVTTGYGTLAKRKLDKDEQRAFARRGLALGATHFGDPMPARVARGVVLARLANFVDGHAAVRPALAEAVVSQLNGRIDLPKLLYAGQGASGEVQSLYPLFQPIEDHLALEPKEDGALVNGCPASAAMTADAALASPQRFDLAVEVFALAAEAFAVPLEHFDPVLASFWGGVDDMMVLQRLSDLIAGGDANRRPYQGAVSLRVLPRLLSQAMRCVRDAESASGLLSEVSDNPVFLMPDDRYPLGRCISNGGFHNARAAPALDGLASTWADLTLAAARMVGKLLDGTQHGLPLQLTPADSGAPGGTGYLAYLGCVASACAIEAREAATRTLLEGIGTEGSPQNDIITPVFSAWAKEQRAGLAFERALAVLSVAALEALAVAGRPVPPALHALESLIRQHSPAIDYGRPPRAMGVECGTLSGAYRSRIYDEGVP